jgi:hypothetical protein
MEDLEGHGPVVPEIVGQEDRGHPTPAELALEAVGRGKGWLKGGEQVGQARFSLGDKRS